MNIEEISDKQLTHKLSAALHAKFPHAIGFTIGIEYGNAIIIQWHGLPTKQAAAKIAEKYLGDFPIQYERTT